MKHGRKEELGLGIDKIATERIHGIGNKEEGKRMTIIATFSNYKQHEKVLHKYKELKLWEDQIYINEDFSEYTVEKRRILLKCAKEIRERDEYAKAIYNRLILY